VHIAIASSDGETINEHFGKANRLFIYDFAGERLTLLFVRAVTPLSTGDPGHAFDPQRMAATMEALRNCARVYCTRIGERPREELEKAGIEVVVGTGAIAAICG